MQEDTQENTRAIADRNPIRAVTKFAWSGRRYQTLTFVVAILALTALSTHGTLDDFAGERLTETTIESFAMYGVARGLNATISVVQSTEVDAVVVSTNVGEVLDPVNDAIERFSTIMTWALGSLLLQSVVLAFVSSALFEWLFAFIALVTISTLIIVWSRRSGDAPYIDLLNRFCGMAFKLFVVAAVVRFIVPVFVMTSYLAGQALLQPEIDRRSGELSAISEEISGDDQQILDQLVIDESGVEGPNELDPESADENGILDRARDAAARMLPEFSMPDFSSTISNLLERAANLAEYLTRLLVLMVIKNIVLPLVFLAIALKVIKPVTMRLLAMTAAIDRDLNEIKGAMKQVGNRRSSRLPEPR